MRHVGRDGGHVGTGEDVVDALGGLSGAVGRALAPRINVGRVAPPRIRRGTQPSSPTPHTASATRPIRAAGASSATFHTTIVKYARSAWNPSHTPSGKAWSAAPIRM